MSHAGIDAFLKYQNSDYKSLKLHFHTPIEVSKETYWQSKAPGYCFHVCRIEDLKLHINVKLEQGHHVEAHQVPPYPQQLRLVGPCTCANSLDSLDGIFHNEQSDTTLGRRQRIPKCDDVDVPGLIKLPVSGMESEDICALTIQDVDYDHVHSISFCPHFPQ